MTRLRATHEWLILVRDDETVGSAYGQPLKQRLASLQPDDASNGIHHRSGSTTRAVPAGDLETRRMARRGMDATRFAGRR